ncbi:ribosome assembly cofactor RimP [Weeksellaceae bacterium KMM 9724]|uniref:ribosome assembly cofactor RimP n=1 Tax=Profundicola chukchiensis TaxID=2961959 RepID=UPI0024398BB4|nr:ribosome assembly cofactor RimP [Profundicola chukchiensis]MDG4950269.1 ribosome assembly cofactor RimP [Profundicola chukchiensis]
MENAVIQNLIDEAIAENPELFLVDWSVSPSNKIEVLVDGDNGLSIDEVVRISRHIDQNLDRDVEDYSLTVSSPGLSRSLDQPRQFKKNIGRKIKIQTEEGESKGTIVSADEEKVTLEWKVREPKPIGKGKHTVQKSVDIPYENIVKAIIQIDI